MSRLTRCDIWHTNISSNMIYGCDICHAVDIWACHMSCLGFKKNQEADMKKYVSYVWYIFTRIFSCRTQHDICHSICQLNDIKNDNICQAIWHIRVFYVMSFSKKRVLLLNDWHIWPEYVRWMILKPMTYVKQYDISDLNMSGDWYWNQWHMSNNMTYSCMSCH